MNIYQKLICVRKEAPYLKKENSGAQYNYVSSSQVLGTVRSKMDELGLLLIPKIVGHSMLTETIEFEYQGKPKKTTTYFTELEMIFTWINSENPEEKIECPWYAQGVDTAGEKGVGKCVTYAEKYFMLKFFNIATDKDDPDSFQRKHDDDKSDSKPSGTTKPDGQGKASTTPITHPQNGNKDVATLVKASDLICKAPGCGKTITQAAHKYSTVTLGLDGGYCPGKCQNEAKKAKDSA